MVGAVASSEGWSFSLVTAGSAFWGARRLGRTRTGADILGDSFVHPGSQARSPGHTETDAGRRSGCVSFRRAPSSTVEHRILNPEVGWFESPGAHQVRGTFCQGHRLVESTVWATFGQQSTRVIAMKGSKHELRPGVWRIRVYAGRRPNGSPMFRSKTVKGGVRAADRELAKLIAEGPKSRTSVDATGTVEELLERWLEHSEAIGRAPTTLREYRRIVDKVLMPEIGSIKLSSVVGARSRPALRQADEEGQQGEHG